MSQSKADLPAMVQAALKLGGIITEIGEFVEDNQVVQKSSNEAPCTVIQPEENQPRPLPGKTPRRPERKTH